MKVQSINTQVSFKSATKDNHKPIRVNYVPEAPSLAGPYSQRDKFASDEEIARIVNEYKKAQGFSDPIAQNIKQLYQTPLVDEDGIEQEISIFPLSKEAANIRRTHNPNALNMEQIKSIILPKSQKASMRSFEDSDKKLILDRYQKEAIDSFTSGKNTVVAAPTGTGKTLIAEYGIEDALKKGERIIYLSPLKALSNEKFVKFSELFGKYDKDGKFLHSDNVGIITGDVSINPDAQLLVMTTEIYRNLVNRKDPMETALDFKDFSGVIYDEFHYLKDPDRGTVWEEAVMHTPKHMSQMMLSATASNAQEITQWLEKVSNVKSTKLIDVPEDERYVPLKEYVYGFKEGQGNRIEQVFKPQISLEKLQKGLSDRQKQIVDELEALYEGQNYKEIISAIKAKDGLIDADSLAQKLMSEKNLTREKAEQIAYVLADKSKAKKTDVYFRYNQKNPSVVPLVRILDKMDKTPALFFVFSKKKCKKDLDETAQKVGTLLTPEQSKRVLDVVNEAKESGIYLGDDFEEQYLPKLLMGYSVHHAGMLPAYKSLVEKLAREGLIKACFATETLLAGINMPFKTVVFTSIEKFDGRKMIQIPPTAYKQGAGRAGRRGKDDLGNVIVMPTSESEYSAFKSLMSSTDTKIKSAFNLSYASLLQNSTLNSLDDFLENSFFTFQAGSTQKIKKEAKHKVAYLKEKGFIENVDGENRLTKKGEMAKDVYGINQILFCELMSDPKYTQDLTPAELAALMVIFADVKDDRPRETFEDSLAHLSEKVAPSIELAKQITKEQTHKKIDEPIKMSTNLVESILTFANTSDENPQDCLDTWNEIFTDLKSKYILSHEGDLLRVFNGTIDLLRTIDEVSDDPDLRDKAKEAISMLKKPPVTDILKYELDIS